MKREFLKRATKELEREIGGIFGKKTYEEFKKFALQGLAQLTIAIMLGAASQKVIASISSNLIMPFVNYLLSYTSTDWRTLTWTPLAGLTFEFGQFLGACVEFLIIAIILFFIYKKVQSIFNAPNEITCCETMDCPYCKERIHWQATVCPKCTSILNTTGSNWLDS